MKKKRGFIYCIILTLMLTMLGCATKDNENSHKNENVSKEETEKNGQTEENPYVFEEEGNSADRLNPQSGGADKEALEYRKAIMEAKDELNTQGGTVYYISAHHGNDTNTGLSPEEAVKSLKGYKLIRMQLKPGDTVLFERNGVYRGKLVLINGVQYGAYGTGAKPAIYGSLENYSGEDSWTLTETENVWVCETYVSRDVGNIVFNHGQAVGIRRFEGLDELQENFDFYWDKDKAQVYLYLDRDPSTTFYDIEICEKEHILQADIEAKDITIDNLAIKYGGAHGISFNDKTKNIKITNCEIGWVGGSLQNETVRYGNGIEFWMDTANVLVENNWIYQIYDAGLTNQGADKGGYVQADLTYRRNLIEYCSYALEFFTGNAEKDYWENVLYEENILRFSGCGWGVVRPNPYAVSLICGWGDSGVFKAENFVIKDNIFDSSRKYVVAQYYDGDINIEYTGNTYYHNAANLAIWKSKRYLQSADQKGLESSVSVIESKPKAVKFLGKE